MSVLANLKQRVDYTYKHNMRSGRHGWLRLTPAYSVKIVEDILSRYPDNNRVLDPFCGSGTTALCAARLGLPVVTTDINPFLVWLATVKTKNYSRAEIKTTRKALETTLTDIHIKKSFKPAPQPPIHNIERWWSSESISFLCRLKGAINNSDLSKTVKDLLNVAFCRTLITLSNAAFNHQSMSFKNCNKANEQHIDKHAVFRLDVAHVLEQCKEEIHGNAIVKLQDARYVNSGLLGTFDLVITSPPYANRMSYITELRPYMYWLDYLLEARQAGELDWQAIGGTWGVATSRLNDWVASNDYQNDHLTSIVKTISQTDNKHSETLARYVHKYCEDIFTHLSSVSTVLNKGARVHYIVGNSTFYGALVSIEKLYADMMHKIGFLDIEIETIRKRNSKKELVEFNVSATWP